MKGKAGKGPPSTDLLVCFPTRAHLTLMPPKSICSPVRPSSESTKGQSSHHRHHPLHRRKGSIGVGQGNSPVLWATNKPMNNDISEPTSPKVTCAGQIKVRPKPNSSCKNWQSVMEEIERVHNSKKHKKRPPWAEALGFKKDVMQFLTCLRNIRFDFRCFGAFPTTTGITSDDEDDEEDDDEDDDVEDNKEHDSSKTVFSKWFMVIEEKDKNVESYRKSSSDEIIAPPPNALLLMRCRSAPAKSWLEEREEEEEEEEEEKKGADEETVKVEDMDKKEEIEKSENLILRYGAVEHDLGCKFSSDIAKETWIVGGIRDSLSRSRSWKS